MTAVRSAIRAAVQPVVRSVYGAFDEPKLFDQFLGSVPGAYTFSRSGAQTGVDSSNLLYQAATGVPAYINGQGVLLEAARTNLALRSEEFDHAGWGKIRSSVTSSAAVAPDGTTTADMLVEDTTATNTHYVQQTFVKAASALTYTFSVYLKAATRSWARIALGSTTPALAVAYINLSAGSVGTTSLSTFTELSVAPPVSVGNGWWRCGVTATSDATTALQIDVSLADGDASPSYTGDGASGIYVWGAQLEQAAFASSYIPTTSAAVTRNATSLSRNWTLPANNFSGRLVIRMGYAKQAAGTDVYVASFSDGTANNRLAFYASNASGGRLNALKTVNGGASVFPTIVDTAYAAGARINLRFRQDATGFYTWINASSKATTTSGDSPTSWSAGALNTIKLAASATGTAQNYLTVESLTLWHEAKSDTFLAALT